MSNKDMKYRGPLIINGVAFEAEKADGNWSIKADFDKLREFFRLLSKHQKYLHKYGFFNIKGMIGVVDSLEKKYQRRGKRVGKPSAKDKVSSIVRKGMNYPIFSKAYAKAFPGEKVPTESTFYKYKPK